MVRAEFVTIVKLAGKVGRVESVERRGATGIPFRGVERPQNTAGGAIGRDDGRAAGVSKSVIHRGRFRRGLECPFGDREHLSANRRRQLCKSSSADRPAALPANTQGIEYSTDCGRRPAAWSVLALKPPMLSRFGTSADLADADHQVRIRTGLIGQQQVTARTHVEIVVVEDELVERREEARDRHRAATGRQAQKTVAVIDWGVLVSKVPLAVMAIRSPLVSTPGPRPKLQMPAWSPSGEVLNTTVCANGLSS